MLPLPPHLLRRTRIKISFGPPFAMEILNNSVNIYVYRLVEDNKYNIINVHTTI